MDEQTRALDPSFIVKLALGVVSAVLSSAIIASFAMLLSMGGRLTAIETIIAESKEERRAQIQELRDADREIIQRMNAIERAVYGQGTQRGP